MRMMEESSEKFYFNNVIMSFQGGFFIDRSLNFQDLNLDNLFNFNFYSLYFQAFYRLKNFIVKEKTLDLLFL